MRFALILALVLLVRICPAQTTAPDLTAPAPVAEPPKPAPKLNHAAMTAAELQKAFDQLTQSNRDLLDLLKKQQSVLEDMQYDRRLESRQIQSLEERLEETLQENSKLQNKVATLEAAAAAPPPAAQTPSTPTPAANTGATNAPVATDTTPAPPETYLPAPDSEGAPGTMSWHRLFTLKGSANQQTDPFIVVGRTWRVLWHNQDPAGKVYQNTSALFINAFPKNDIMPLKVCSKLGSGGDKTELAGPGTYYLKVEASGGSWELAVEDFR
jgi:hypothetical protein